MKGFLSENKCFKVQIAYATEFQHEKMWVFMVFFKIV